MCYYNTCSAISRPYNTQICVNIAQPGSAILTHLFLVCGGFVDMNEVTSEKDLGVWTTSNLDSSLQC